MNVTFLHPATGESFEADCEPGCTGEMALQGLKDQDFIDTRHGASYSLVLKRTNKQILPDMTLGTAGVIEGDSIGVLAGGEAAKSKTLFHRELKIRR